MHLPDDPPISHLPSPIPAAPADLIDTVTPAQREADFNRVFAWHGREIALTILGELYYRELRAHMNAPALGDYLSKYDFDAEAPRLLFCAHQDIKSLRQLRLLPPARQIEVYDEWVVANIKPHELRAAGDLAEDIQQAITRARTQPADTGDSLDGSGNSHSHP